MAYFKDTIWKKDSATPQSFPSYVVMQERPWKVKNGALDETIGKRNPVNEIVDFPNIKTKGLSAEEIVRRIVTIFGAPEIEYSPENLEKKCFDSIRVEVRLVSPASFAGGWSELRDIVKTVTPEINRKVMKSILEDTQFQKHNISPSDLRVSSIMLTRDATIEYIVTAKTPSASSRFRLEPSAEQ